MTVDESSSRSRATTDRAREAQFIDYLRRLNHELRAALAPTGQVRNELSRLAAAGWQPEQLAAFIRASHPGSHAAAIAVALPAIPTQPTDTYRPPLPPGYLTDDELAAGAGIQHTADDPSPRAPRSSAGEPVPCCGRRHIHTSRCPVAPNQRIGAGT